MLDLVWVKLLYVVYTAGVVVLHMEYVHRRRVEYTRSFILVQLAGDLLGFPATWMMLRHFRPEDHWINWFLGVHWVVHMLSLAWALLHWKSLKQHMLDFQARQLHPIFQATEFLYEQSDTALYLATVAIVGATLPTWAMVVGIIACSTFFAAFRPTAGFARSPQRSEVASLPKAA